MTDYACNLLNRLEVSGRTCRKPGFHDVNAQTFQLQGNAKFVICGHGRAGALFPVTQRRVENNQFVSFCHFLILKWRTMRLEIAIIEI
jgi:hypothetical protein